jgi:hypothetical protein
MVSAPLVHASEHKLHMRSLQQQQSEMDFVLRGGGLAVLICH